MRISRRFIIFVIPALLFLAAAGLFFAAVLPSFSQVSAKRRERANRQEELTALKVKNKALAGLSEQNARLGEYQAVLSQALPGEKRIPALMTEVERIASSSAVAIKSLQFSPVLEEEETDAKAVSLQVIFEGSLDSLLSFTRLVEKAAPILQTTSLRFSKTKESGTSQVNLGLYSHYLPVDAGAKPEIEKFDLNDEELLWLLKKLGGFESHPLF